MTTASKGIRCRLGRHEWITERVLFFSAERCVNCLTPRDPERTVEIERERMMWWTIMSFKAMDHTSFDECVYEVARNLYYPDTTKAREEAAKLVAMSHCTDIVRHGNYGGDNFICQVCNGRVTDIRTDA